MAATLGVSNMSYSHPSLYSSINHASEFSYHDQSYATNGADQPVGSSEASCQILSGADMQEKTESMMYIHILLN
jgi:hypothetical protein